MRRQDAIPMTTPRALAASLCIAVLSHTTSMSAELPFYVGTYTKKEGSKGIYQYKLDTETGRVSGGELAAEANNPTFLALHPNGKVLYAANENNGGAVSAFSIEADGALTLLSQQSTKGGGACHVWVDAAGKNALAANYGGGSFAVLPIAGDGSVQPASDFVQAEGSSVNPQRQKQPHGHAIYTNPAATYAYGCDLGTDKVWIWRFDAEKGTLTAGEPAFAKVAPGSGPRHLALHPAGFAYVINELSNTMTVFKVLDDGAKFEEVQTITTLPEGFEGQSSTAEVFIHPDGKFLYGSNRGHDSIVVYSIDQSEGRLTLVEHVSTQGKGPRYFGLDPEGKFLLAANQQTNNVIVFRVDAENGKLTPTGNTFEIGAPVSIQFAPRK
jgi:6-phosphogluconolactonase